MDSFIQTINNLYKVDEDALMEMVGMFKTTALKKGDFLLKADQICKNFYFASTGLVKLFFDNGDKRFVMTFFKENGFFTELSSFNTGKPSKYMLVALEHTDLMYLSKDDVSFLCKKHHSIDTLFRILNQTATVRMMDRISEMLEDDAKQRYSNFLTHNSHLLQRISLGDLADYIGVTQVSLSRIRGQK